MFAEMIGGFVMARERLAVSVEEAGEMLGISRGLAYELVRRGELPSVRLGRRLVVPVRQLHAVLEGAEPGEALDPADVTLSSL